jgi:plasmid stabilization system protein ParE
MMGNEDDSEILYALRISGPAQNDIAEAKVYLEAIVGPTIADEWQDRLIEAIRLLAQSPRRYPVSPASRFFAREVRQYRYERRVGSVPYYIFYMISDNGEDGPVVKIIHVRHSSKKPLTRSESQEIAKEL